MKGGTDHLQYNRQDIKPKYETIFHSEVLRAVELLLKLHYPELIEYHSITDILPTTDRKRWVIELSPDYMKRAGKDK